MSKSRRLSSYSKPSSTRPTFSVRRCKIDNGETGLTNCRKIRSQRSYHFPLFSILFYLRFTDVQSSSIINGSNLDSDYYTEKESLENPTKKKKKILENRKFQFNSLIFTYYLPTGKIKISLFFDNDISDRMLKHTKQFTETSSEVFYKGFTRLAGVRGILTRV